MLMNMIYLYMIHNMAKILIINTIKNVNKSQYMNPIQIMNITDYNINRI